MIMWQDLVAQQNLSVYKLDRELAAILMAYLSSVNFSLFILLFSVAVSIAPGQLNDFSY